jgi:hypothetical protein
MSRDYPFYRGEFERESMPLDAARTAFRWLVTGPHPLALDGRHFPGLPPRLVPLDETRELLLDPGCPQITRDAVWGHLVERSRADGGAWTVACVGLALPALIAIAADLSEKFADDPRDIHGAVLTGFLAELATVNLARPWVMARLRWAALRAGHTFIRDTLDSPQPSDEDFHSAEPTRPWGHPDFVLARAVAEGAITGVEAELIGSTRLEEYSLAAAAADRGVSYKALEQVRRRAEHRLAAYLTEQAPADEPTDRRERDVEIHAVASATITAAAHTPTTIQDQSRTVTGKGGKLSKKVRGRVLKKTPKSGVQACGSRPAAPAPATRPTHPSRPTPEVPR